jgi:hypothetical protein
MIAGATQQSGSVDTLHAAGILKSCRQQSVVSERFRFSAEPHWYPYVPNKSRFQAKMVRFLGAHDLRRRLGRSSKH